MSGICGLSRQKMKIVMKDDNMIYNVYTIVFIWGKSVKSKIMWYTLRNKNDQRWIM